MNIESKKKNLHVDDVFRNDISFDFIHCTQSKNSIIQHRDNQIPKVRDNRKCQVTIACETVCVLKVKKKTNQSHPTSSDGGFLAHSHGDSSGGDHNPSRCESDKGTLAKTQRNITRLHTCTTHKHKCIYCVFKACTEPCIRTHTHTHMRNGSG